MPLFQPSNSHKKLFFIRVDLCLSVANLLHSAEVLQSFFRLEKHRRDVARRLANFPHSPALPR